MSVLRPPSQPLAGVVRHLPEGTTLYRLHHGRYAADQFTSVVRADPFSEGGRFDSTPDDPYPYLYAAFTQTTALAEALLRNAPFEPSGQRLIPWAAAAGRHLAELQTSEPLDLLDLTSAAALARVGASSALVHADGGEFVRTRHWASLLRKHNPSAQGFVWPSRHVRPQPLVVLFGDRCSEGMLTVTKSSPLDPAVNKHLRELRARITFPTGREARSAAPRPTAAPARREPARETDDFVSFFKNHYPNVCRILNARHDDWELAQEAASRAFEIAYRKWPDVSVHPNPLGWVIVTGRRILMRVYQLQAAQPTHPLRDTDRDIPGEGPALEASTVTKVAVHTAIRRLGRDKRECFVMHYILGYSVEDIAARLQIPTGTVKSRLSAARKGVRDALGCDFREGGAQ